MSAASSIFALKKKISQKGAKIVLSSFVLMRRWSLCLVHGPLCMSLYRPDTRTSKQHVKHTVGMFAVVFKTHLSSVYFLFFPRVRHCREVVLMKTLTSKSIRKQSIITISVVLRNCVSCLLTN